MDHPIGFEELHIWKEARNLVKEVYYQSKAVDNYRFNESIRRAALAVLGNVAEGYSSGSLLKFKAFLYEAGGCCNEIRDLLYTARSCGYMDEVAVEKLLFTCKEMMLGISRMLRKINRKLKYEN